MATAAPKRMTLAEFLEWDDGTDTRYELVRGQIVATAPTAERHGTIVINLGRHLANHLTPPCRAVGQAGIVLPTGTIPATRPTWPSPARPPTPTASTSLTPS